MEKKKLTIDDLLESLQNPNAEDDRKLEKFLENTADNWHLIGDRNFAAIAEKAGIVEEEVNDFLKSWVEDNPYSNI